MKVTTSTTKHNIRPYWTLVLLLCLVVQCYSIGNDNTTNTTNNNNEKKLFIVGGPHQASTTIGIRKFFDTYATFYNDSKPSNSLTQHGLVWPTLDQSGINIVEEKEKGISRYSIFKLLFEEQQQQQDEQNGNETSVYDVVMGAIRESWENTDVSSVIFGHERFDKIGKNPEYINGFFKDTLQYH